MSKPIMHLIGKNLSRYLATSRFNSPSSSKLICHQQKRYLDLQEYQSKQLLHENGVKVQRFKVVSDTAQALAVVDSSDSSKQTMPPTSRWSGFDTDLSNAEEYVVKAQVLAGGRGKGHFKGSGLQGGVLLTKNKSEVVRLTKNMLKDKIVTKQTGPDGVLVKKVMIAEAVRLKREFYFAIVLDRSFDSGPILVTSPDGGMDIEEVAARNEQAIRRFTIPIEMELDLETAKKVAVAAFDLAASDCDIIEQCANEIMKLYSMFLKLDATQVEINPLGVTSKRQVISVDAKIKFDENARFRHRWLDEVEAMNESETDRRDFEARKHNLNFIGLDGSIGCLVNGAGLAMATMDLIKLHGGEPANFLDVGGGASARQVSEALRIISSDLNVKAIFVNIFGGIMRCDVIAEGLIEAVRELELGTQIVCRLQGTQVERARELLEASKLRIQVVDDLEGAAKLVVRIASNEGQV